MTVTGSAFAINTYGSVFFDINRNGSIDSGEPVQYLTTSASGTFSTTLVVPSTAIGTYPVLAAFASSTAQASVSFTVTTTGTTGASLTLNPTSGPVGTNVTVNGRGFTGNTEGGVFFDINRNGTTDSGEPLQFMTTAPNGTFTIGLTVPSVPPGTYQILGVIQGAYTASGLLEQSVANFTVTP